MKKSILGLACLAFVLASCGGDKAKTAEEIEKEAKEMYDKKLTELQTEADNACDSRKEADVDYRFKNLQADWYESKVKN